MPSFTHKNQLVPTRINYIMPELQPEQSLTLYFFTAFHQYLDHINTHNLELTLLQATVKILQGTELIFRRASRNEEFNSLKNSCQIARELTINDARNWTNFQDFCQSWANSVNSQTSNCTCEMISEVIQQFAEHANRRFN